MMGPYMGEPSCAPLSSCSYQENNYVENTPSYYLPPPNITPCEMHTSSVPVNTGSPCVQPAYTGAVCPPAQGGSGMYSQPAQAGGVCPPAQGGSGSYSQPAQAYAQGEQGSPVTLVLNGNTPVPMTPQSVTVGQTTYPLGGSSNPAMGAQGQPGQFMGATVSPLHTPAEIAAGVLGMSPEQIAEAERAAEQKCGAANKTGKKKGKGKKGKSKTAAAKRKPKTSGAAGMSVLAALAVLPLAMFLM